MLIQSIGSDGFGYRQIEEAWKKVPHIGKVIIEDEVEIGANTCIDRATIGATRLERNVKIDNLIQIGHNVRIGEDSMLAGAAAIGGSVTIGKGALIGGGTKLAENTTLGNHVTLGSNSLTLPKQTLPDRTQWWGTPIRSLRQELRLQALLSRLANQRKSP